MQKWVKVGLHSTNNTIILYNKSIGGVTPLLMLMCDIVTIWLPQDGHTHTTKVGPSGRSMALHGMEKAGPGISAALCGKSRS